MPDRETIEQNRINKNVQETKTKQKKARKKRNITLAIFCVIFSVIIIFGAMYVVLNSISDKEELRTKGIKSFNSGNYNEAIDYFNKSLNESQWFSTKMDADTRLYLGAAYIRLEQYKEAISTYDALRTNSVGINTKKVDEYAELAYALQSVKDGDFKDSDIDAMKKELERGNDSVSIYLGTCAQSRGDYEDMVKYYNSYVDHFGMNTFIAYQLSSYYIEKGKYDEAQMIINSGLKSSDDLYIDKVRFNDIVISEKALDYQTAYDKISELYGDYPDNETYKKEYDFLNSRINIDTVPVHTKDDE